MLNLAVAPAPARQQPDRAHTISLAALEQCLAVAAYIVVRYGDAYASTFARLEREVESCRVRNGNRDRAGVVLAAYMERQPGVVAWGAP